MLSRVLVVFIMLGLCHAFLFKHQFSAHPQYSLGYHQLLEKSGRARPQDRSHEPKTEAWTYLVFSSGYGLGLPDEPNARSHGYRVAFTYAPGMEKYPEASDPRQIVTPVTMFSWAQDGFKLLFWAINNAADRVNPALTVTDIISECSKYGTVHDVKSVNIIAATGMVLTDPRYIEALKGCRRILGLDDTVHQFEVYTGHNECWNLLTAVPSVKRLRQAARDFDVRNFLNQIVVFDYKRATGPNEMNSFNLLYIKQDEGETRQAPIVLKT